LRDPVGLDLAAAGSSRWVRRLVLRTVEAEAFTHVFASAVQHQYSNFAWRCAVAGRSCSCGPRFFANVCNRTRMAGPATVSACDAERIAMWLVAGTPLVEARFPSALAGRGACICVAFASSRHAVPLRLLCSSPRVLRMTGDNRCCGERCPCGFRTLNDGSRCCPRSPRSIGRDLDL